MCTEVSSRCLETEGGVARDARVKAVLLSWERVAGSISQITTQVSVLIARTKSDESGWEQQYGK